MEIIWIIILNQFLWSLNTVPNCNCREKAPFLLSQENAELVVEVEVLEYGGRINIETWPNISFPFPEYIKVKIKRILKGATQDQFIRIYGSSVIPCGKDLNTFRYHRNWIMAINSSSNRKLNNGEVIHDYQLSECGIYFLKLSNQKVIGRIYDELDTETNEYEQILNKMSKKDFMKVYQEFLK